MPGIGLLRFLDKMSSRRALRYSIYSIAVVLFLAFILVPPILGIALKWNQIGQVFENQDLLSQATSAVYTSFGLAIFVSIVDVIAGLPLAWYISRGKSRWLNALDTFADIPFVLPTVALGYSILLFWSSPGGLSALFGSSLVSPGWLLVLLLHFVFSFPIIVRVMVGALLDYQTVYEEASRTLGAAPLTADRTVTLSILKPSIVSAFILAFARSLSETGATVMVAGVAAGGKTAAFVNGPVFISLMGKESAAAVFVSVVLIAVAISIFAVITLIGPRLRLPTKRVWPKLEKSLSGGSLVAARNLTTIAIFIFIVLIPALFVALPALTALVNGTFSQALAGTGIWGGYWQSLMTSYFLGAAVTVINLLIGLPMAVLIARKRAGRRSSAIMDILVNIPLIVPSIALGASMSFFWGSFNFIPEIVVLIFAHMAITYPYFVRSMSSAIERVGIDLEEASKILGARPLTLFRTVVLPLTKYSLFAGALMVFTRSVDETGATLAVISSTSGLKTAPVLLVDWVKGNVAASPSEIGLGIGVLVVLSFAVLLILRFALRGNGER